MGEGLGCNSVVEHLPRRHKSLNLTPSQKNIYIGECVEDICKYYAILCKRLASSDFGSCGVPGTNH
jgi:hypothetical protein